MEDVKMMSKEILKKAINMNFESLDLQNGSHITFFHVGLTVNQLLARMKKKKANISTFKDKNCVSVCLWEFFTDEYAVEKDIAKWICNVAASDRKAFNYFVSEKAGTIGSVVLPNGGVKKTDCFRIVLQRLPMGERDNITGMPFKIISMYPILWN